MSTTLSLEINPALREFLAKKTHKLLIAGQWVESASGAVFQTYNPATGEIIGQVSEADATDIDRAVKAAR
ncbi:MAG: aldehyde dehydrogenase family protein, partial [Elusimicrobia bacterium]|nr:aldehyde dehydrogenase family protein [Elusimicrobiota bacterium]